MAHVFRAMSRLITVEKAVQCCEENSRSIAEKALGWLQEIQEKCSETARNAWKHAQEYRELPVNEAETAVFNTVALVETEPGAWQQVMKRPIGAQYGFYKQWQASPPKAGGTLAATLAVLAMVVLKRITQLREEAKKQSCRRCVEENALSQSNPIRTVKCKGEKRTRRASLPSARPNRKGPPGRNAR